jgi:hypothetical protein
VNAGAQVLTECPFAFVVQASFKATYCQACCRKVGAAASRVGDSDDDGVVCSEACGAAHRPLSAALRPCCEALAAAAGDNDCDADLLELVARLATTTVMEADGEGGGKGAAWASVLGLVAHYDPTSAWAVSVRRALVALFPLMEGHDGGRDDGRLARALEPVRAQAEAAAMTAGGTQAGWAVEALVGLAGRVNSNRQAHPAATHHVVGSMGS